jgi:hypothetical protein
MSDSLDPRYLASEFLCEDLGCLDILWDERPVATVMRVLDAPSF